MFFKYSSDDRGTSKPYEVLVGRGYQYIVPRGGTVLEQGDDLIILANKEQVPILQSMIEG